MDSQHAALVVRQDVERRGDELLYREEGLSLSADGLSLVLHCYFENYQPGSSNRVACSYQVPLAEFMHWMIGCGQLRIEH